MSKAAELWARVQEQDEQAWDILNSGAEITKDMVWKSIHKDQLIIDEAINALSAAESTVAILRVWCLDRARELAEAHGYCVVSREPTEAMLNAARDWSVRVNGLGVGNDQATGCYRAMIAASEQEKDNG